MLNWNDTSTWRVLFVDDEVDNLEIIVDALRYGGVETASAKNGIEALEVLKTFPANLIITDLSMPGMNGWELRMKIKNDVQTQNIPVMALSAHAMSGDKERVLDAGFDGYLAKPVSFLTLIDDIRAARKENSQP